MAIIKQQITVEVDTNKFTPAEWKEFINKHLSPAEISRTMVASDMFWLEKLKERAIVVCAQGNLLDFL